jgi:hypothetical protein
MFCPKCGLEDPNHNQFCRSCGTSLQAVRSVIDYPDATTASAVTAREEIGRAIAAKIAEIEGADELRQTVHEIVPALERLLETPEQRRLYHQEQRFNEMREGVLASAVGLAILILSLLLSWITHHQLFLIIGGSLGLLVLLIGLGITATAKYFSTLPKESDTSSQRRVKDTNYPKIANSFPERPATLRSDFHSVTEGTTREL